MAIPRMLLDWDSSLLLATDKFNAIPLDYIRTDVAHMWSNLFSKYVDRWFPQSRVFRGEPTSEGEAEGTPNECDDPARNRSPEDWSDHLWLASETPARQAVMTFEDSVAMRHKIVQERVAIVAKFEEADSREGLLAGL